MKVFFWAAVLVAAIVLQTAVFPLLPLYVKPDIIATVVFLAGALLPQRRAIGLAAGYGLVVDGLTGKYFPLQTLTLAMIAWAINRGSRRFYQDNWLVPLAGVFTASVTKNLLIWGILALVGRPISNPYSVLILTVAEAFYNTLVAVLLWPWLRHVVRRYRWF